MEAKLTALATTDGLTGIYNRAYFNEQLHEEFTIILPNTNGPDALKLGERLRQAYRIHAG